MKNFIQPGASIDITVPAGGVTSGDVVIINSLIGISSVTALEGERAAIQTEGVYELPKTNAQAWAIGAKIYWDATNKVATTTASGNILIGIAADVAANPSAIGWVKLGAPTV